MKLKFVTFWLVVFGALFTFLQINFQYHFFYIEQSQLFLFSGMYLADKIVLPGGLALLLSEFLVQFFIAPYAGAAIVAALLTGVGMWTAGIVRRIAPSSDFFFIYLLPALALLFMHFDFNYLVQGTIAYIMLLKSLYWYVRINAFSRRMLTGFLLAPLLFWLAGPVALLFACTISLYELLNKTAKGYWILLSLAEVLLIGICMVYFSIIGEYRWALGPDAYYHDTLHPKTIIYYSWVCLPLIVLLAFYLRSKKPLSGRTKVIGAGVIQFLLIVAILCWGIPKYGDKKTERLKKLDYFARTGQWDKTIQECTGKLTNFLYMCHLNMALAQKGELADRMFHFDQRGVQGLMVQFNKSENISCLLSDLYFTFGGVANAQQMAFEGSICAMGGGNARMLKRLVQTNLIYGAYPVAEKYITLLEQTFGYRDWARSQRKFLNNDQEVEKDPILGVRRRGLSTQSVLTQIDGLNIDLERLIDTNPSNATPLQYLGAFYLLSKDLTGFKAMVEKYYGTEALPVLPASYQEAIIVLSEKDPEYWKQFAISESVVKRFGEYKSQVLAYRNDSSLPGLMMRAYGETYWYYFMFK